MFARENILIIGPPGTAKTMIAERIASLVSIKSKYFYSLLSKFSTPDEIFGPISIQGLKEDRLNRKTKLYLPQSSVAILDEIFKSSSAILNTLL